MSEYDPIVSRYLQQLQVGLQRLPTAERDELVREIENHIAEATAAGKSIAEVLEQLGPADRLARAYTADALLSSPPAQGRSSFNRWMAVAGLLLTTSLPSLILIPLLGGIGIGFTIGGGATIIAGIAAFAMPWLVNDPFSLPYGVPQILVVSIGIVLAALGVGSCTLLISYFKFLVRTIRRVAA